MCDSYHPPCHVWFQSHGHAAGGETERRTDQLTVTSCAPTPDFYWRLADDIYREDVVFRDPRNTFRGLKNYKTIFWSLRFHGRLFFKVLYVDVQRLWQPDDSQIR